MGTRGFLGFIIHSSQRHAAYNHFDSYFTGLGKKIVEFILCLTTEEYDIMARLASEIKYESTPSLDPQERAPALRAVRSGVLQHMVESIGFFEVDTICQWSYFIDFEGRKLETWDGRHLMGD
ncbi:hypothetical protein GALMADRAFT_224811 [Galerina marginata CBS 339.88]|uniref:Uncharacterized protein n=1 Tax=Galerina marginata (strain CBS 339.88) TaxID=685588 RepID=A0A067T2T2_GALM3|nr:hypothetical protein GALMADRAFT_224811 [Galerina marginata CBS 339.88]